MSLSILIVNWKSRDLLRNCLATIPRGCAGLDPRIVVVDGGSYDGCGEMLAAEHPEVEFVQSTDNIGFARSNNLGFARVTGDRLLLLNPDTELKDESINILLRALENLPSAGIVSPRLLNSDGSFQTSCVQSFPTPLNQALDSDFLRRIFPEARLWGLRGVYSATEPVEVEAVSGACMLMRAETYAAIGGFNPQYFMYGEDMDLCRKVHRAGLKVYHVPTAEVVHHGGGSTTGQVSGLSAVWMRKSIFQFIHDNGRSPFRALLFRVLIAFSALSRIILLSAASARVGRRQASLHPASLQKWKAIFNWTLGLETVEAKGKGSSTL